METSLLENNCRPIPPEYTKRYWPGAYLPIDKRAIRTLHNRDPHGACAESLMPAGYMTTNFRTNVAVDLGSTCSIRLIPVTDSK